MRYSLPLQKEILKNEDFNKYSMGIEKMENMGLNTAMKNLYF